MTPTPRAVRLAALLALAVAVALPAAAAAQRMTIDVSGANFKPLPMAVAPFQADPGATATAAELGQVLRNDLALSGLFELLDPKSFLADPAEGLNPATIRFSRWSDVGADGLVKAVVRSGPGEVLPEFHLYEVRAGRDVASAALRGAPDRARTLAHQFADQIVEYYTREPGVFRTRIVALRKLGRDRELVAYDVDGQRPEVLLHTSDLVLLPTWRPDGKALLYTAYHGGRSELWVLDVATHKTRRLLAEGDLTSGGVYSPDGKRIAFTASRDGNSDVFVAAADGTGIRRLTTDPAIDGSPTWSPDGKRLCFVSNRAGNPHLYLMNADGSDQRRLTFQGNYNQTPRWSPRGDLIAFTARDERKVFDVFTISPENGRIQRVTQDQGRTNEEPTWAPSGRLLAFTSDRSGRPQLIVSSVNGERQVPVTSEPVEITTPAWSPFGR